MRVFMDGQHILHQKSIIRRTLLSSINKCAYKTPLSELDAVLMQKAMTRFKYSKTGGRGGLPDRLDGSTRSINKWTRLKAFLPMSSAPSTGYLPIPSYELIQPAGDDDVNDTRKPDASGEEDIVKATDLSGTSAGPVSIVFIHNQPCRELGEDEDFRCMWLSSSDEDDRDDGLDEDKTSASSYRRLV